jgi:TRAP-type C4-dicarboxylate transport system substrate-binding protein
MRMLIVIVAVAGTALALTAVTSARKAGGSAVRKPVILELASHDDLYAYGTFAAAVRRLSGGWLRIVTVNGWRDHEVDYERGIVGDVRAGKAQLGIVGVRVWDRLGVVGFRALVAPFLIDSLALEGQALQSPLATRALAGVQRGGVVGIALLPGVLRRPFGITRPLVRPDDYQDAMIGIRPGGVAAASLRALGATAKGYVPGDVDGLDGAELDLGTIAGNGYDRAGSSVTANVALWPRAQTVVMNRRAFNALTPRQRQILLAAGGQALQPELARVERDGRQALSALCQGGRLALPTATPDELAALRAAVQPLYDQLDGDPATAAWITAITQMRVAAAPDTVRCP